jgi:hypothetical protein
MPIQEKIAWPLPPHLASLIAKPPSFVNHFGSITRLDANDLPILKRLSIRVLCLRRAV